MSELIENVSVITIVQPYVRILPTTFMGYDDLLVYDHDVFKEIKGIVHSGSPSTDRNFNWKKLGFETNDLEYKDAEGRSHYRCRLIPGETTNVLKWLSSRGYKILVSPSKSYEKDWDPVGKAHLDFVRDLKDDEFKEHFKDIDLSSELAFLEIEKKWLELQGAANVQIDTKFSDYWTGLKLEKAVKRSRKSN